MEAMGETGSSAGGGPVERGGIVPEGTARLVAVWALGLLAIYLFTLRPSISWNDAPELVDVAYTLGIAHPPGIPTYALLGKLLTLVPAGSVALRINLLSALCAVSAVVLLALISASLHARWGGRHRTGLLAGMAFGTLLALAPTYWSYATQAEVYAPLTLVVALLTYLALRWKDTGDERYVLGAAFLFGLAGGIHGTVIFFAPALAFFLLTGLPRHRLPGTLFRVALFGVLGASVYLYLPVRAATEPAINWGHPDTWSRFWAQISDRKDVQFHPGGSSEPWWPFIKVFARNLNHEITAVGGSFGLLGLLLVLRRSPRWALFTLLFCLGNALFFIRIWTIPDAFLPTFWFVMLWGAGAAAWLFDRRFRARGAVAVATTFALLIGAGTQLARGVTNVGVHLHDGARSSAAANLLPLTQDAIVFTTTNWFPLRYLQDVEGMRPDVTVLLVSDLTSPQYFNPVTLERFPNIQIPRAYGGVEQWEAFFQDLLRANLGKSSVYWEPLTELNRNVYPYLHPWRYLWRFDPQGPVTLSREEMDDYFADLRGFLERELQVQGVMKDFEASRYHAYLLTVSSEVLLLKDRPQDALVLVELADRITTDNATVANQLGRLYSGFGRWADAERMFRRAAENKPGDPIPLLNVAVLQMSLGRLEEAEGTIAGARALDPDAPEPYYQLFELEKKRGSVEAARAAIENAILRARDDSQHAKFRAALEKIDAGAES